MFKKITWIILAALAVAFTLSACQLPPQAQPLVGFGPSETPVQAMAEQPTPVPSLTPTPRPSPTFTPTSTPPSADAVTALEAYFAALEDGAFDQAAGMLSRFGLSVAALTRGEAQVEMQARYAAGNPQNFAVQDSRLLNPETALVEVQYALPGEDGSQTVQESWALRNEEGEWLVNWGGLVDFVTPSLRAQTTAGVTVLPTRLLRYTDRLALEMIVQNRTNDWVYFGQDNEVLATFIFADQTVEAENTRIALAPLRSYKDVRLELKGWYDSYPQQVEIRRWLNYQVDPWYVFVFGE